jgi:DivIVA domain-containing protein
MNGDDVRDAWFRHGGYDASEVDGLLRRVAVELDAGRPVGQLISNATFRRRGMRGYDHEAVDWFLDQLRSREDHGDLAGTDLDPWRGLAVASFFSRSGPGLAEECAAAGRDFHQVPGTPLRWAWAGAARRELQTAERQTIASFNGRSTFSVGVRTFTRKRVLRSGAGVAEITSPARDFGGHFLDRDTARSQKRLEKPSSQKLGLSGRLKLGYLGECRDESGAPVLYISGNHMNRSAGACITFPDQRWLRFPVRCTNRANAIMTAVDQGGNKVARYRVTGRLSATTVEITVHPEWKLADELVLAILISAPWLPCYFTSSEVGN